MTGAVRVEDMGSGWTQFGEEHWLACGIAVSVIWFLAGRQSFADRKPDAAIAWQCVSVFVILIVCGWAVARGEWIGLAVAIVVLYFEVRSIKRIAAVSGGKR